MSIRLDRHAATTSCIGAGQSISVGVLDDHPTGREIWTLDEAHQVFNSDIIHFFPIPQQIYQSVNHLPRLCGGMLVAMPTAIPVAPLTSRLGIAAGKTSGSSRVPSKFSLKSTVFFWISESKLAARVSTRLGVAHRSGGSRHPRCQSSLDHPPVRRAWKNLAPYVPSPRILPYHREGDTSPILLQHPG